MRFRHTFSWLLVAAVTLAAGLPAVAADVPMAKPNTLVQDHSSTPLLPAARKKLEDAVRANSGAEQYRILLIDTSAPRDLTAFLDATWEAWQLPANSVLLVVATQENNAIRFALGTDLGQKWGVSVDYVLGAIRNAYSGPAREGRLADALATLVAEIHKQVVAGGGTGGAAPAGAPAPAVGKEGPGFALPAVRLDPMSPALPWVLVGAGAAVLAMAVALYTRRLRRWNQHLQARLDRVLMQKEHLEQAAARQQD